VSASLSRTGVATAALAVAITTVNGVGLMISSFRWSLAEWLETTLTADLYVGFEAENGVLLDERALRAIEGIEGIAGVSLARNISVPTVDGDLAVRAVRPGPTGWGLSIVSGVPAEALAALAAGSGVAVSERLMFSRNLRVGDSLALPTPRGELRLPIVGGFRDFNTGRHSVVLSLELYRRTWSDPSLSGVGLHLQRGAVPRIVEGAVPPLRRRRRSDPFRAASTRRLRA
jgi:putative ABC transport system permease protein